MPTWNEIDGMPENFQPIDTAPIQPGLAGKSGPMPAPTIVPMPPMSAGTIPPSFQLQPDLTKNIYGGQTPTIRTIPVAPSGQAGINSAIKSTIIQETTGGTTVEYNGIPAVENFVSIDSGSGISISVNGTGTATITGTSTGDGLTHGTTPWETDPSAVILSEDFFGLQNTSVADNNATGPFGASGWTIQGDTTWPGLSGWGGLFGGSGGSVCWDNSSSQYQVGALMQSCSAANNSGRSDNAWPLLDYPGWKASWVFKVDNGVSNESTASFSMAQKSLYVGFAGAQYAAQISNSAYYEGRPTAFLGVRYDTSDSVFQAAYSSKSTMTGGQTRYNFSSTQSAIPNLLGHSFNVSNIPTITSAASTSTSAASSFTTGTFTNTTGDLLVAFAAVSNTTLSGTPITDLGGNTWTLAGSYSNGSFNYYVYYAQNSTGFTNNTVTIHLSSSNNGVVFVYDAEGVETSGAFDVIAEASSASNVNSISPSITTTNANDLIFAFVSSADSGETFTFPSGWTTAGGVPSSSPNTEAAYNAYTAVQTGLKVTMSQTLSAPMIGVLIAFKLINAPVISVGTVVYEDTTGIVFSGSGGNSSGVLTDTTPPPNDTYFTFEFVNNYGSEAASITRRNNKQGQTFVTSVVPQQGCVYRLDITCSSAGSVTCTLNGYNPVLGTAITQQQTTFTLSPTTYLLQFSGSTIGATSAITNTQTGIVQGIHSFGNASNTVAVNSQTYPFVGGSKVTFTGLSGVSSALDGTFTLNFISGGYYYFDIPGTPSNVSGSTPNNATASGYPALLPFFSFGNDDTASPSGGTARFFADYVGVVVNPNLGSGAPGTPNSSYARYF